MNIEDFIKLELKSGDLIWIINEKGEGYPGSFEGSFDLSKQTFKFRNHSNGKLQIIEIYKLQLLVINQRV